MKTAKVTIIAATEKDPIRAAALLIFSKHTRLNMSPEGLDGFIGRCANEPEWMMEQLDYMSKTIRSSWELLDVTFMVENVSRACAQQMTRTRQASYAMQSQRVTDMSNATWHNPLKGRDAADFKELIDEVSFDENMEAAIGRYRKAVEKGMNLEDARGLLPINLHCNLIAKYNLRTLADLLPARMSYRAQGEYQDVAAQMKDQIIKMWPWAELFFRPKEELAKAAMNDVKRKIASIDGFITSKEMHEIQIALAKLDDIVQGGK